MKRIEFKVWDKHIKYKKGMLATEKDIPIIEKYLAGGVKTTMVDVSAVENYIEEFIILSDGSCLQLWNVDSHFDEKRISKQEMHLIDIGEYLDYPSLYDLHFEFYDLRQGEIVFGSISKVPSGTKICVLTRRDAETINKDDKSTGYLSQEEFDFITN